MAPPSGLPLHVLATQPRCAGVRFHCRACALARDLPFAVVAQDLDRRGLGGWSTPIAEVAAFARRPCPGCGQRRFATTPWWR